MRQRADGQVQLAGHRLERIAVPRRGAPNQSVLQFAKFCVVGAFGVVVNLCVFASCTIGLGLAASVAATVSFGAAVCTNYFWNRSWTFRDEQGDIRWQGVRFLLTSGAALLVNILILRTLVSADLTAVPAQAIAILAVAPLSFAGNKLWAFRLPEREAA
jgi:putative flippase GtrA